MERMRKRNHLLTAIVWIAIVAVASSMLMPMEAFAASRPGQVKSLKASSKSYNSIRLTWKKVKGAKGYQVYRATSKNGRYKKVKTTKSTSYTNGKLTTGKRYYYKVRAYKGSRTGGYSSKKSAVPTLSKPSVKSSASTNTIKLTWGTISGAKGYQVDRKTSSKGTWSRIKTTSARSYSATIGENKTYYYRVRAYRKVGKSTKYSSYSSTKTTRTGVYKPSTPSLSASAAGTTTAKTSWSKASNATGYQLYRATAGGSYARILTTKSTSYTNSRLKSSTSYYYKVRAYRTVGNRTVYGNFSSARLIKTNAPAPPKPSVPSETKDCYLPYKGTKIWIGQTWTDTLNAQINQAATGSNKAVTKIIHRKGVFSNTDVYLYDTITYNDFLAVYVSDNVLTGWNTTSDIFGVYHDGKKAMTLRTKNPASTYIDFVKDPPAGDRSGIWLSVFEEKMKNDAVYQQGDAIWGGLMTIDASSTYLGNLADESRFAEHIVNALRVKHSLNPLKHNSTLYGTSGGFGTLAYAETMAASHKVAHSGFSDGPLAGIDDIADNFSSKMGYTICVTGENAAKGGNAEGIVYGWYTSSGHKAALLDNVQLQNYNKPSEFAIAGAMSTEGLPYWAYHSACLKK